MSSFFLTSIDDFVDYCKSDNNILGVNGICEKCVQKKQCEADFKNRNIDSLASMESKDSRYPNLISFVKDQPGLLYSIPKKVYKMMYGSYNGSLPCPFCSDKIISHLEQIKTVYDLLDDATSKLTFINVLLYRLTLNRDYALRAYSMEPQYFFEPYRALKRNEVFVDCGAYTGDTFLDYCKYNEDPQAAYLFEPDKNNLKKMKTNIKSKYEKTEIHIVEKGVYRYSGELYFNQNNKTEGYISEEKDKNSITVAVASIDEEIKEDISFLKMDIEGTESEALLGAKQHICSSCPKLAISVYHKPEDLWEIPLLIKETFPKYSKYAMRHHSCFFNETVLYAYS